MQSGANLCGRGGYATMQASGRLGRCGAQRQGGFCLGRSSSNPGLIGERSEDDVRNQEPSMDV